LSAFDPVYTVGAQIVETLEVHGISRGVAARHKVEELLRLCGVPDPRRVSASYPHELSGGLRQRAMIALAVSCGPRVIVADEPTSSLDVTVQAHILALFRRLRRELGLTVIFISHDPGVLRSIADEVLVLCDGRLISVTHTYL
jgi:ABC-type dipeptide/oligopeptide/nickel transport system ATPase component